MTIASFLRPLHSPILANPTLSSGTFRMEHSSSRRPRRTASGGIRATEDRESPRSATPSPRAGASSRPTASTNGCATANGSSSRLSLQRRRDCARSRCHPGFLTKARSEGAETAAAARRTRVKARSTVRRALWPRSTSPMPSDPRSQPGVGEKCGLEVECTGG